MHGISSIIHLNRLDMNPDCATGSDSSSAFSSSIPFEFAQFSPDLPALAVVFIERPDTPTQKLPERRRAQRRNSRPLSYIRTKRFRTWGTLYRGISRMKGGTVDGAKKRWITRPQRDRSQSEKSGSSNSAAWLDHRRISRRSSSVAVPTLPSKWATIALPPYSRETCPRLAGISGL